MKKKFLDMTVADHVENVKSGMKSLKDKSKDGLKTFTGDRLLEENLKYYEQVTQIMVGLDTEFTKLQKDYKNLERNFDKIIKPNYKMIYSIIVISNIITGVIVYLLTTGKLS